MKKIIFLSSFFLVFCIFASNVKAEFYPESSAGVTPPVQYAGLQFSTRAVTTSSTTVKGPLTVASVCFSTSAPSVFVELRMSTNTASVLSTTVDTIMRVYNTAYLHNSSATAADSVSSGCVPVNVYVPENLIWDTSVATLNHATVLLHKHRKN